MREAGHSASIGDLATFVGSGVTPRGGEASYVSSGVMFLRSQNVHFDGLRLDDVAHISAETHAGMARTSVAPGDILLNITGASIGRVTVVPEAFAPANVNQHVCIIRVRRDAADPRYVAAFLGSDLGQHQIWARQAGLSRQALNYEQVRAIEVPVPPLDEQRRIAAVLSAVDSVAHHSESVRTGVEALSRAAIAECFGRIAERRPLGECLARIEAGWSPQCEAHPAAAGEWGVLKVSAVSAGHYRETENKALPSGLAPRPAAEVREGDLLLARASGVLELVGRTALVRRTRPMLMLSDKLLRLVPNPSTARADFLHFAMQTVEFRQRLLDTTGGSHMRNISQETLRMIPVALPCMAEQERVARALLSHQERIEAEEAVAEHLRILKVAVTSALFGGRA